MSKFIVTAAIYCTWADAEVELVGSFESLPEAQRGLRTFHKEAVVTGVPGAAPGVGGYIILIVDEVGVREVERGGVDTYNSLLDGTGL